MMKCLFCERVLTVNHKKREVKLYNVLFTLTIIMFVLIVITTYFTSGVYARYTQKDSIDDTARVASVDVNIVIDEKASSAVLPIKLAPGESVTITAVITSLSEVTVKCNPVISVYDDEFTSGIEYLIVTANDESFILEYNESKTVTYTVKWDETKTEYLDYSYSYDVNAIMVSVTYTQVN